MIFLLHDFINSNLILDGCHSCCHRWWSTSSAISIIRASGFFCDQTSATLVLTEKGIEVKEQKLEWNVPSVCQEVKKEPSKKCTCGGSNLMPIIESWFEVESSRSISILVYFLSKKRYLWAECYLKSTTNGSCIEHWSATAFHRRKWPSIVIIVNTCFPRVTTRIFEKLPLLGRSKMFIFFTQLARECTNVHGMAWLQLSRYFRDSPRFSVIVTGPGRLYYWSIVGPGWQPDTSTSHKHS